MKIDSAKIEALRELLAAPHRKIVLVAHTNPDGDAIGASTAWRDVLAAMGHEVTMIVPNKYPYFLDWMPDIREVVIFRFAPERALEAIRGADIVFCLDFNSLSRLEALSDALAENTAARRVLIDHHLSPDGGFDLQFSYPQSSSTCFLLYCIIEQLCGTEVITRKMAEALYVGMMTDTGNFSFSFLTPALYRALAVSELNAAMGRVVAAPTAGSCGILPAAVLTMQEKGCSEHDCVMALFTASAVGMVITTSASVAGAQGGCQAECGSAAAMAAAAIVELAGGTPRQAADAVAMALKNILGLVCDPVAGLVEIPCIKRNASGVAGAFVAAELALAGIESAIPADEVIVAMKKVGDAMSPALKETAEGGLAATPTARRLYEQVFGRPAEEGGCTGCGGCAGGR